MPSTTYNVITVTAEGENTVGTKSKKATAVELARDTRAEGVGVRVETNAGTVVFELAAPKKINMSKPYTRVVDLPEGAKIPAGARVAYTRNRKNAAIVHLPEAAEGKQYAVVNFVTGKFLAKSLPTTRACGRFLADEVPNPVREPANA